MDFQGEIFASVGLVCATVLAAMLMLQSALRSASAKTNFVFALRMPLGMSLVFAGGELGEPIKQAVLAALHPSPVPNRARPSTPSTR